MQVLNHMETPKRRVATSLRYQNAMPSSSATYRYRVSTVLSLKSMWAHLRRPKSQHDGGLAAGVL